MALTKINLIYSEIKLHQWHKEQFLTEHPKHKLQSYTSHI